MSFPSVAEQLSVIKVGLEEILTEEELVRKLEKSVKTGVPLRVKQGFDPTAPDIHLGHTVGLRVLERFQRLGHQVVVIVGDATAMVGDPSGKSETRPRLTAEEIAHNAKTYQDQIFKILVREKTEIRYNNDWFSKMGLEELLELTSHFTVARMLERDDFEKRFRGGVPISVHEFLYPLMQGYDSVVIEADVEIGATEQTFNLLAARSIQRDYGQEPQVALTFPILPGVDGVRRMSKSLGNYVGVDEAPEQMFGKMMSIPDDVVGTYAELVSQWGDEDRRALAAEGAENPMAAKARLARRVVELFHDEAAGREAEAHFDRVVRRKEEPDEIPTGTLQTWGETLWLPKVLKEAGLAPSTSEARRLVQGGGVTVDGEKVSDPKAEISGAPGSTVRLKVGKRKFLDLTIEA